MMWVFGVAIIVLVIAASKKNRPNKNLGFPASRKQAEKTKRRKERDGKGNVKEKGY
jgi:hypothetical protein